VFWGEPARNFEKIVGKGDLVSVQGRLEYRVREIDGKRVQEAVIRVTAWTQHTPKRNGEAAAPDPDGDGFQDEEAQLADHAGDTDLTGELAGDGYLPTDLPSEGDLPVAGDEPIPENLPAEEDPATADPTSTRRRKK